jgi:hypothetical protein
VIERFVIRDILYDSDEGQGDEYIIFQVPGGESRHKRLLIHMCREMGADAYILPREPDVVGKGNGKKKA